MSERPFEAEAVAPVEAFISPADLPQPKNFEVPLRVVKVMNELIRREWDGHKADLDISNLLDVFRNLRLDNAEDVWRKMILYAERRGWKVDRKQYPYRAFYRFTPK